MIGLDLLHTHYVEILLQHILAEIVFAYGPFIDRPFVVDMFPAYVVGAETQVYTFAFLCFHIQSAEQEQKREQERDVFCHIFRYLVFCCLFFAGLQHYDSE